MRAQRRIEAGRGQFPAGSGRKFAGRLRVLFEAAQHGQHGFHRPVGMRAVLGRRLQCRLGRRAGVRHQAFPVGQVAHSLVGGQLLERVDGVFQLAVALFRRRDDGHRLGVLGTLPLQPGRQPPHGRVLVAQRLRRRRGTVAGRTQRGHRVTGVAGQEGRQRRVRLAQPGDVLPDRLQVLERAGQLLEHAGVQRRQRVGQDLFELPLQHLQADVRIAQRPLQVQQVAVAAGRHAVDQFGDPGAERGVLQHPVRADLLAELHRPQRHAIRPCQAEIEADAGVGDEPPRVADLLRGRGCLQPQATRHEPLDTVAVHAAQFHPRVADPVRAAVIVVQHQPADADRVETFGAQLPQVAVQAQRQQQFQGARLPGTVGALEDRPAAGEVELLLVVLPDVDDPAPVQPPAVGRHVCASSSNSDQPGSGSGWTSGTGFSRAGRSSGSGSHRCVAGERSQPSSSGWARPAARSSASTSSARSAMSSQACLDQAAG